MLPEAKLKDFITMGTWEDVRTNINEVYGKFDSCCTWIRENADRTERNLTLYNLLNGSLPYLDLARQNIYSHIQLLALCTRSVFEIDVRARYILLSDDNIEQWKSELVTDRIELMEGVLELRESSSDAEAQLLEVEIKRLTDVARRHKVNERVDILSSGKLAKQVGLGREHKSLFKLFSKLVHPSSYSINYDPKEVFGCVNRNILAEHLQLYAIDLLNHIKGELGIPNALIGLLRIVGVSCEDT